MVSTAFAQSESKRFKMKAGVSLVIIQNNQVLLSRRANIGIADGLHLLPLGGVEESETALDALIREAKEETNLSMKRTSVDLVHTMHRLKHLPDGNTFAQIDLFFRPRHFTGTAQNMEPERCDELKFYDLEALPKTTEPFVVQALKHIRQGISYSEIGWNNQ